jgi:hypothetical protein
MKKIFLLTLLIFGAQYFVQAQKVELTPFGGYVFPTRWSGAYGSVYCNGAAQYGGILSIATSRVVDFNIIYNRIDTKGEPEAYGIPLDEFDLSENFYMVGVTKNFRVNEKVSPFVSFNLGGVYFAPKNTDYYSYWFFAMGADAGVKVYFSKVVGIRLQTQLMFPVQYGGFSFYYGSGGGGSSVYVTSTMLNFGFTGGLIFRLGNK